MKNSNVAIFIPHNGCKHECSFCNQRSIVGQTYQPNENDVIQAVEIAKNSLGEETKNAEIAFFGGSFTAIDRNYMKSLLSTAYKYVKSGDFKGIRISTRPDYIDDEILEILNSFGVTSIELGAQSMDNEVLIANNRGHLREDVIKSSYLIKEKGFSLGLQMMTGLYKSTKEKDIETCKEFIKLAPETVRVYPTVVIKGTQLENLYRSGAYLPFDVNTSVDLCSIILKIFNENNINVIRLGLHASKKLEEDYVAGAYHPAFRELCESKLMLDKIINELTQAVYSKNIEILVNEKSLSKAIGQKKCNIVRLKSLGYDANIKPDKLISKDKFKIINCR